MLADVNVSLNVQLTHIDPLACVAPSFFDGTHEHTCAHNQMHGKQRIVFLELPCVLRNFTTDYEFCVPHNPVLLQNLSTEISAGAAFSRRTSSLLNNVREKSSE